tara:strand:+ start:1061 stop:1246 length:186 start_codon:yes stop_codon:yes gene_type:complete
MQIKILTIMLMKIDSLNEKLIYVNKKVKPVMDSINGYCKEILFLHSLHFPSKTKYEKIGIL